MRLDGQLSNLQDRAPQREPVDAQLRALQQEDARLRANAGKLQARAQREGQSVTTQVNYLRGPDGKNYVSSITVTRSETVSIENESARQPQPALSDIAPPRLPFSPTDLAESFSERQEQNAQQISEKAALTELQRADNGVRVHEGLHFRAAGGTAEGITDLEYIEGPDGQFYAVAGHVDVRTSATNDPDKAARDAQAFAMAATAPADASAQDNHAARGAFGRAAETYGKALDSRGLAQQEYDASA